MDRRMGKNLSSWQGHDSPIVKISIIDDHHFISVAERSGFVWSINSSNPSNEPTKLVSLKNMPETTTSPLTPATTIISSFDSSYGSGGVHGFISPDARASQNMQVVYGLCGHRL